ncbi:putative membrane protein [Halorubrum sp. AJ67]|nr:putative membrane protein [Halorubrum sp. AJ67]
MRSNWKDSRSRYLIVLFYGMISSLSRIYILCFNIRPYQ